MVDLFKFCSLNKEREEQKTIFLETVVSLMEIGSLIGIIEEALNINHVVNRHARNRLSKVLNIGNNKVAMDVTSVRPVTLTELNISTR
jgi:hypothetical protein